MTEAAKAYVDRRRMQCHGVRYWTAVCQQSWSQDLLIAWTGFLKDPKKVWYQGGIETRGEFYARVESDDCFLF